MGGHYVVHPAFPLLTTALLALQGVPKDGLANNRRKPVRQGGVASCSLSVLLTTEIRKTTVVSSFGFRVLQTKGSRKTTGAIRFGMAVLLTTEKRKTAVTGFCLAVLLTRKTYNNSLHWV